MINHDHHAQNTKRKLFEMILNQQIKVHHPLTSLTIHKMIKTKNKQLNFLNQGLILFKSFKNLNKNVIQAPCIIGTSKQIDNKQKYTKIKNNLTSLESSQMKPLSRCQTCSINKIVQNQQNQQGQKKKRKFQSACQARTTKKTLKLNFQLLINNRIQEKSAYSPFNLPQ